MTHRLPVAALLVAIFLAGCPTIGGAPRPRASTAVTATNASAAPSAAPGASASPGLPASPGAGLAHFGQVLGLDGLPAAGVTVHGFLSDAGTSLITENGAGVIANNAGNRRLLEGD